MLHVTRKPLTCAVSARGLGLASCNLPRRGVPSLTGAHNTEATWGLVPGAGWRALGRAAGGGWRAASCCCIALLKKTPTPCLWQAPASTQKTKRKTRPAIRRSARWRAKAGGCSGRRVASARGKTAECKFNVGHASWRPQVKSRSEPRTHGACTSSWPPQLSDHTNTEVCENTLESRYEIQQ